MKISTVGVVGAGVMGSGVAQSLVQAGYRVVLTDVSRGALDRAEEEIRRGLRFHRFLGGRKGDGQPVDAISKLTFTTDFENLRPAEFVIENVPEVWETKREVFAQLDSICSPQTVFAANTSAIPITRIGSLIRRPSKLLGIHFMNPVPLKKTVEVIRGYQTSEETMETAKSLLAQMDKEWVVVNDSPGFISNRVLMLTINEAIFLVHESVAVAEDVDKVFRDCFAHKMGPLETADLIGLDTILFSIEVLHESFADSKYRPCPLLKKMVAAGLHGRKSGQGFYSYPTDSITRPGCPNGI